MTAKEYAAAYRVLLKQGTPVEDLNRANHYAFEKGEISFELFKAAAQVLAETILKR